MAGPELAFGDPLRRPRGGSLDAAPERADERVAQGRRLDRLREKGRDAVGAIAVAGGRSRTTIGGAASPSAARIAAVSSSPSRPGIRRSATTTSNADPAPFAASSASPAEPQGGDGHAQVLELGDEDPEVRRRCRRPRARAGPPARPARRAAREPRHPDRPLRLGHADRERERAALAGDAAALGDERAVHQLGQARG